MVKGQSDFGFHVDGPLSGERVVDLRGFEPKIALQDGGHLANNRHKPIDFRRRLTFLGI